MNWKSQAALAAVLFTLGSFAYWFEYTKKPQNEAAAEQEKKVFRLKDTSVEAIRVTTAGKVAVEIKCLDFAAKQCKPGDTSKWEITAPLKMRADDANANGLVSSLANLDASDSIDLKEEKPEKRAALLKEYGLDPASITSPDTRRIEVRAPGRNVALYLGLTHAIGEGIFAVAEPFADGQQPTGKVDENKVYVVPSYFKANLEKELTYWRDKKLITLASHEIGSFELKGTKSDLAGERKSGLWTLEVLSGKDKGQKFPGDNEGIDSVLNGATFLMAKDFAADRKDDAKAKAALKGARPLVSLTLKKEAPADGKSPAPEPITLTLYQKNSPGTKAGAASTVNPRIYATVSSADPLFELEPFAKDRLDKELKDLRQAKLITSMERFQVKKLELSGTPVGGAPLSFSNADGQWSGGGADKAALDQDKFQSLLDKLSATKIREFVSGAKVPKGEETGIRLALAGDEKTPLKKELVFWQSGGQVYARESGSKGEAFLMDKEITAALPWSKDFFKKSAAAPAEGASGPAAAAGGHS
jgi:hypothetical protein